MIESWRRQFSLKQLSPSHEKPIIFTTSQWQREYKPNIYYLTYRWLIACYFLITIIISIVDIYHPDASLSYRAKWLIYLTNWGYTTCTLQALLAAIIISCYTIGQYRSNLSTFQHKAMKFYKFYWITNTIATDIAFGITSIYWSLIYDEKTMALDALNIIVHGSNSFLMFFDLFMVAHPVRLLHCFYPLIFGICYAIFSVIYYEAGGISKEGHNYIYKILQWSKPQTATIICIAVLGFIVVIHIIVWSLYKFRLYLHKRFCNIEDESNELHIETNHKDCYDNQASDIV